MRMILTSFMVLVFISCLLTSSYALTFLAQKQNIVLNYGDKKLIRVPLSIEYDKYYYIVRINNLLNDENLKVLLLGEGMKPLHSTFNISDGKDAVLVIDNKVIKMKELYLMFHYYSPSSRNIVKKVDVEILPIKEEHYLGDIIPKVSPSIYYTFNVYLNAYIFPTPSYSSPNDIPSSENENQQIQEYKSDIENGSVQNDEESNSSFNGSSNLTSLHNYSTLDRFNEAVNDGKISIKKDTNSKYDSERSILPTGEVIQNPIESISISTVLIFILGLVILYIIWRRF